jgi:Ca2+-binding EF-hand superfamily protein
MDENKDLSSNENQPYINNQEIFLSDWEKSKVYKKLVSLVTSSSKSSSQKQLLKIKKKLLSETCNQNITIYTDLEKVLSNKNVFMTITDFELKKILPNSSFEHNGILSWLGIRKISEKENILYNMNINKFLKNLTNIMLHEMNFEQKVNLTFSMYDQNNTGVVTRKEVENLLEHFNDYNSLNFDYDTMNEIVNVLMEELDPENKNVITKNNFERFLHDHKTKPLTFNPFTRERTYSHVVSGNENISDNMKSVSEPLIGVKNFKISKYSCFIRCKLHLKSSIWLTTYILCNL